MKLSIGATLVIFLVISCLWLADVASDRANRVKITGAVSAYNDWQCGYQNQSHCRVVFEVKANSVYDVQRIRYGKDFMAIKIRQDGVSGWVLRGEGVHIDQ